LASFRIACCLRRSPYREASGRSPALSSLSVWRSQPPVFATSLGRRRQYPRTSPNAHWSRPAFHGWSRNPIYLGLFLVYGGIGLAARSPWALILTLPLAITIRYGVVAREEAYLEGRFGDAYREYKARVRRWI